MQVVADTTKVRIFKQITTANFATPNSNVLLLIPQRYEFSSKSQPERAALKTRVGCCWYHKGTNFQANHNILETTLRWKIVVADTTKVRIFKQITTASGSDKQRTRCCWYHKGTNFQANHNDCHSGIKDFPVVADTTKVRIFKQITTTKIHWLVSVCCCWYHKGTNFQANHNSLTSVKIFSALLLIPQRYEFSSKSQLLYARRAGSAGCCWYHKGTNFQANHNPASADFRFTSVVADTTKVRIFKQITTKTKNRY